MSPLWVSSPDVVIFYLRFQSLSFVGLSLWHRGKPEGLSVGHFGSRAEGRLCKLEPWPCCCFWLGYPWDWTCLAPGQPGGCLFSHVGSKVSALRPAAMICWKQPWGVINMAGHKWPFWRNVAFWRTGHNYSELHLILSSLRRSSVT